MQEFVDFLGKQAPYDALEADDLERLAARVEVEFFPSGATVVPVDSGPLDRLHVVRTGVLHVLDDGRVVDELGPGDTYGQQSVLSGLAPTTVVRAETDALVYLLPDPRPVVQHPERLRFRPPSRLARGLLSGAADYGLRPISEFVREPLWCRPDTPIRDAARAMTDARQSCVLVDLPDGCGIVTDSDCRARVVTGEVPLDAPVVTIASTPVRSIEREEPAAAAFLLMLQHHVHHLVVVDADGRPVGVCRVVDLAGSDIRDPLAVRAAIEAAGTLEELTVAAAAIRPTAVELAEVGIPALRIGELLSTLVDSVVEKCISWVPPFADDKEGRFAWMLTGSLARREWLPGSDLDTGLIWRLTDQDPDRGRLLEAAREVLDAAEACGLERCRFGANADSELFNRHVDAWVRSARRWENYVGGPKSMVMSAMIVDSRPITGLRLGRKFGKKVRSTPENPRFRRQMLREALDVRPPVGFVRDFVVESDGAHKGQLDIKGRALNPIVGIGRWVAVCTGAPVSSTQERLASGVDAGLLSRDESAQLRHAHEELYQLIFEAEIDALRAGRAPSPYLDPKTLDGLSRRHLRQSFKAIEGVQDRLENEWLPRFR